MLPRLQPLYDDGAIDQVSAMRQTWLGRSGAE
jgi:hypothetical protein